MARRQGSAGSSIRDDETWKTHSSEVDDEAVMTRMRHFGEDEGRAASQREEVWPCGLGMKCARDEAVLEVGMWI